MTEQYYNPCGLMIMPYDNRISDDELIEHVYAANYTACLSLDDAQFASRLNRPYNIFRSWSYEPHPLPGKSARESAEAVWKKILPWALEYRNNHIYINNEQSMTKARLDMYAELIKLSVEWAQQNATQPVGFVFGNFASGSTACGQGPHTIVKDGKVIHVNDNSVLPTQEELERGWRENNDWYRFGELFLRTMFAYRDVVAPSGGKAFVLGDHQYTTYTPWFSMNGGDHINVFTWKDRPRKVDWAKPQWHLGRTVQGIMQATKKWNIDLPWMIITESLFDTMNDVIGKPYSPVIELPSGVDKPRGYKTYALQWPKWFPEFDSIDEAYAEMLIYVWETIYAPLGNVLATLTYSYGDTGDWWSFDVKNPPDSEYIAIMEDYRWLPIPTADEIPLPIGSGAPVHAKINFSIPGITAVNIRSGNSVFYKVKAAIASGKEVYYYPKSVLNDWVYVEAGLTSNEAGWISLQSGKVTFIPIVDTPPADPSLPVDGWYEADATAFAVGAVIYAERSTTSKTLGFIKTANAADRVKVKTVFNPKLNPWRAIEWNGIRGWVQVDVITFYPNEPALDLSLTDPRWARYRFTLNALPFRVYKQPGLGQLHIQYDSNDELYFMHIPLNELSAQQQSVLRRVDADWLPVKYNDQLGFIRARDVIRVELETPNPDGVVIDKATITAINEAYIAAIKSLGQSQIHLTDLANWLDSLGDVWDDATGQ